MADSGAGELTVLDQAIFTSARGATSCGYHLVARSGGVTEVEARDLSTWCPSHDALAPGAAGGARDDDRSSLNFHPLGSGRWCLSRTSLAGAEFTGRGQEVFTHCWLVDELLLERCGQHPFAVERLLARQGVERPRPTARLPVELPTTECHGQSRAVDELALSESLRIWGVSRLSATLDVALARPWAGFVTAHRETLAAALLYCMPPAERRGISFTTGLVMSPRRAFRWHFFCPGTDLAILVRRFPRDGLFDVDSAVLPAPAEGSWAEEVSRRLRPGKLLSFARELGRAGTASTTTVDSRT